MARLLSGSTLRSGGSGEFIELADAMPQLPATETTLTGFTLVTNEFLQTSYRSSLGFVEFTSATLYSSLPEGTIKIIASGTVVVSTGTTTGLLVVEGDMGVGGGMNIWKDITVNGLTIGRGFEGINNIVIKGIADPQVDTFENGQQSIVIGYDALQGLITSYKNIAVGRYALSSGTEMSNNIAIGDSALKLVGVSTTTLSNDNVALGVDAGTALIDGQQNVFIGHEAGNLLTTGSYNIIIGPITGQYLYTGSGIISIGGDNIVDGKDDQVNIGSVFYYDGSGYAYVSAETTVGLGTTAHVMSTGTFTSSSTVTGGLVVVGGIFGWDNLVLVNNFDVLGTGTNTMSGALSVGKTIDILGTGTSTIAGPLVPSNTGITLGTIDNPFSALYLEGETLYLGTITLKSYGGQDFTIESPDGFVTQTIGNLILNSGVVSTGSNNGSLVVTGGVSIGGGLNVSGTEDVYISPAASIVSIKPSAGGSVEVRPNAQGTIDNMLIGSLDPADAIFTEVEVVSTLTSTSTTTGALTVAGGVGIRGNVYAETGNPSENYLLYTPRSSVSLTAPLNPRVGDFWINPSGPYFLQYVDDGGNKIWVQI
jgi:hypothetical protein